MDRRQLPGTFVAVAVVLGAAMAALLFVQARASQSSAGRTVGVLFEQTPRGELRTTAVLPGQPAARGGLEVGDVLISVDGVAMKSFVDYDVVASRFEPGRPVTYRVRRGDEEIGLTLLPGVEPSWGRLVVAALVGLICLGLGLLTVAQRESGLRARLLSIYLLLLALEVAIPLDVVGHVALNVVAWSLSFLVTGAEIGIGFHLAAVIPSRRPLARVHRFGVPAFYVAGIGVAAAAALAYVLEDGLQLTVLPWSSVSAQLAFSYWVTPAWAAAMAIVLGRTSLRYPDPPGRMQAALVLFGLLPLLALNLAAAGLYHLGIDGPAWITTLYPLFVLPFPIAVFAAIFRYQLFDIELVVRRGLVYTGLTTALLLVFYALLGIGGALFTRLVETDRPSVWVTSAATLILGLLFNPIRRTLEELIDRRLFPERRALRQRLVDLASELPAQGKVDAMGEHLVARLGEIFGVRSATLFLAEPRSGLLSNLATTHDYGEDSAALSLLFAPQDPGIELLRQVGRAVPASEMVRASPGLEKRLAMLETEVAVPLSSEGKLVGVLLLGPLDSGQSYRSEDLELLNLLARHAAAVFENVRLFQSATYESLTGLLRREAILELLSGEVKRARRYERPLTVGFADLDHFKLVNDQWGHLAGDRLLARVAQRLSRSLRPTDAIGRYGGEEFLLVFPETDLAAATEVAESIRKQVEEMRSPVADGRSIEVRVSIGLASLGPTGQAPDTVSDLLAAADQALYRAKAAGRNRVEPCLATAAG